MKQRFLCVLLAAVLCLSVLSGCAAQKRTDKSAESGEPKTSTEKVPQAESTEPTHGINQPAASPLGFTNFDSSLIAFLCENGYAEENFAVSPLSFRAALALAASGAEGETLNQLLAVMGFSSVEQMNAWYSDVLAGVDRFDDSFNSEFVPGVTPPTGLSIRSGAMRACPVNSVRIMCRRSATGCARRLPLRPEKSWPTQ